MMVDLLYLAWNRLELTRESYAILLRNTDWQLVRKLWVWDDGSTDGTREWLREAVRDAPVAVEFVETSLRSPVAVTARFAELATAPLLAKIDNDVLVPDGWLSAAVSVMQASPELSLLGLEPLYGHQDDPRAIRSYVPAAEISGLGLFRREAFARWRPAPIGQWFGFAEWQRRQHPRLVSGWLSPGLPLVLLDRLPFEPWQSLTRRYVAEEWQRPWDRYAEDARVWSWRFPARSAAAKPPPFDVVILSAQARNLVACVRALLAHEPSLTASQIIVVDDGARAEAEPLLPGVRWVEGQKPFVFARNANLGIEASGRDVVLLNDDALLATVGGLSLLSREAQARPSTGLFSSAIHGVVGNSQQLVQRGGQLRDGLRMLCFVCVYIPRAVAGLVGPLDERFTGYGFEDDDYSARVRAAGLTLAVHDGCVVDHSGKLPSTFRTRQDRTELFDRNRRLFREKQSAAPDATFLGVMRVKNESRHIEEVLESALPLCGKVLVFDDHSDDGTPEICRKLGPRVEVVESPFQGLDEARDKNFLLGLLPRFAPDWVLWIDGDEVLERSGPEQLRAATDAAGRAASFSLRIAYAWDFEDQIRVDGIFGNFRRPSLFRWRGQRPDKLYFPSTRGVNLHCGNVPRGLSGGQRHANVRLKHYGYLSLELRQRKYEWYTRVDPGNVREDHYRHLAGIPGARHAPGPPVIVPWAE